MNLKVYLATKNMTVKEFSNLVEAHPAYVSRIISGKVIPSKKLMRHLIRASEGKVDNFTKYPLKSEEVENNCQAQAC